MIGSSLNRRDLVASLAGAGVVGGIAYIYNADDTDETGDTRSWTERTRQGIQTHRTTDLTVTVSTAANEPVADATVDVEMQAHDFQFGTAVNAARLIEEGTPQYRERLRDLFNTGVLEAHHKWATWENNAKLADSEDTVTQRVDFLALKLSHDLSEGGNPLFKVSDGSESTDHYAVLTNETALNDALRHADYGDLLTFDGVLALWNDDEEAYNLVVDDGTIVDFLG